MVYVYYKNKGECTTFRQSHAHNKVFSWNSFVWEGQEGHVNCAQYCVAVIVLHCMIILCVIFAAI